MATKKEHVLFKSRVVKCKCPMCKTLHKQSIVWRRSTRPWIYCNICKPKAVTRGGQTSPVRNMYSSSSHGGLAE